MQIIAVVNQKGGVAKTTTAHAIGTKLALSGKHVLFVDADAQGNLTYMTGARLSNYNTYSVITGGCSALKAIQRAGDVDVLCASSELAAADVVLTKLPNWQYRLRDALQDPTVRGAYDYVIIDSPPAVGAMVINILTAADIAIAPARADVASLTGLNQLYANVASVKKQYNPQLRLKGVALVCFNPRGTLPREVSEHIAQTAVQHGTKLFNTRIRTCSALEQAAAMQQSIFTYAPKSNAAADYTALLNEILE